MQRLGKKRRHSVLDLSGPVAYPLEAFTLEIQCPNMLKQLVYGTFLGLINLQFLGLIGLTVSLFYEFFGRTKNVKLCLHTALLVQTVLLMSLSNIRNILNEFQFVYSF